MSWVFSTCYADAREILLLFQRYTRASSSFAVLPELSCLFERVFSALFVVEWMDNLISYVSFYVSVSDVKIVNFTI